MNKLMVTFASLLIAVPAVAMELVDRISQKEDEDFISHVLKAVEFNRNMVEEKEIGEGNAIHLILDNLSRDIAIHNNLVSMLKSTQYKPVLLQVLAYQRNTHNQLEAFKDKEDIKIPLVRACQFAAEYYLQEMCPQYKKMRYSSAGPVFEPQEVCAHHFDKWSGGGDFAVPGEFLLEKDRIYFMNENADYLKVDDEKEKQARIDIYIANILYQDIFAKQVD